MEQVMKALWKRNFSSHCIVGIGSNPRGGALFGWLCGRRV